MNTTIRERAFTLIELLVVIVIISIIAAILFPVFATAREKARQSTCASNEKQILAAMIEYSSDYDEFYPSAAINTPIGHGNLTWQGEILPYLQPSAVYRGGWGSLGPSVFTCPDDTVARTWTGNQYGSAVTYALPDNGDGGHYACGQGGKSGILCGGIYGYDDAGGNWWAYSAAQILQPSTTLMLVEFPASNNGFENINLRVSGPFYNLGQYVSGPCTSSGNGQDSGVPNNIPIHSNGWNYGFVDGHVKWMLPIQTIGTPNGPAVSGAYCNDNQPIPGGMWSVAH